MSIRNKFFTFTAAAAATFAFSTIGMAQEPTTTTTPAEKKFEKRQKMEGRGMGEGRRFGRGMGERRGRGMRGHGAGMMFRSLNLTDAQKTQIQSIMAANKPSQATREEMKTLMMAKRTGVLTTAQQERLAAIKTANQAKRQTVHEQFLGVLTTEQKAQIEQKKLEMKTRMEERRQNRQQKAPAATTPKEVTKDN
jgi:Spy/CpxP family protein refolding chaperone